MNEGGINGLGESLVNLNSTSFLALKEMIITHSSNQSDSSKMENGIISLRFQMGSYLSDNEVDVIVPAGSFIERLLKVTGISKKKFSECINYDYSNLIAVLKGRRKINTDLAIKAGNFFGINPAIWLHIESKNEILSHLASQPSYDQYSLSGLMN